MEYQLMVGQVHQILMALNQSFSTSRPYFARASSDYTSGGNISGAAGLVTLLAGIFHLIVFVGVDPLKAGAVDSPCMSMSAAPPARDSNPMGLSVFHQKAGELRMWHRIVPTYAYEGHCRLPHHHRSLNRCSCDLLLYRCG
jgi:hypothetical protein